MATPSSPTSSGWWPKPRGAGPRIIVFLGRLGLAPVQVRDVEAGINLEDVEKQLSEHGKAPLAELEHSVVKELEGDLHVIFVDIWEVDGNMLVRAARVFDYLF